MVFIDAMNLYEGLQDIGVDTKLDYFKFSLRLVGPQRRLIRAHVYTSAYDQVREPEKCAQQMRFFNKVHRMSFVTLKTRPLIARGGTYLQKGVDTLVATFPRSRSTAIAQNADQELVLKQDFLKDCY